MHTTEEPTLRLVLGLGNREGEDGGSLLGRSAEAEGELMSRLGAELPAALRAAVRDRIESGIADACEITLSSVLAGAWRKYQPLREYCDATRHPTGETATVELASHEVRSSHRPTLEILMGKKPVFTLQLDARISLELEGAVLTVGNGSFLELATGTSRVSASLSYKGATLIERKSGRYPLPGKISFGEGYPICPDLPSSHRARVRLGTDVPIIGAPEELASENPPPQDLPVVG
jgi:hypothetical protein